MHSFDKEEMSEESLYVKDVLKTWGYEQVEIKSLKPLVLKQLIFQESVSHLFLELHRLV
jgi:hypothetical protein